MFGVISKYMTRYHLVSSFKNAFSTEAYNFPKEINSLKLMGTIQGDVERLKNGAVELILKTIISSDILYCTHRVIIANPELSNMWGDRLKANQRIYVSGKLQTENLYVANKRYQTITILANTLYRLGEDESYIIPDKYLHRFDQNSIEMMAFIGSDVKNFITYSVFSLMTHYHSNKGKQNETIMHDYHKVIVPNDAHMLETARFLRKNDRVYLKGRINYSSKTYPDGKEYVNGYILPKKILKLSKSNTSN